MLRVLQMSLPDERTAQLVGLVGAVGEVAVRIFYFNLYLKAGIASTKKGMDEDQKYAYALRGKMRVQDGTNDMIVEYLSSIVSSMLLIILAPYGVFSFASNKVVSQETVLVIMAYQIVPEIFLDLYVTFMECFCGLARLHESYWDTVTGGDAKSALKVERWGNLFKASIMKINCTVIIVGVVLFATLKLN